ncbi:hypothetical protein ONE63_011110 [Megalurothrips usitatus]|uniref:Uncharacterized protein n=1 Tax=Megalurothrips usitatus TaxID=439358 RepID=A0AAV7XF20_9NEOP|nr:hypothetical protein ONE63_011110 [Megalurothrips usitatus]
MDSDSESDGELLPQRSRSTRYRRFGSRKRRHEREDEADSDAADAAEAAAADADVAHPAPGAPNGNDELQSDSDWSVELDAVSFHGTDEDEGEAEADYDPGEDDFVVRIEAEGAGADSDEEDEVPVFGFSHGSLDRVLQFSTVRTVKESFLISLALSKALWKILGRTSSGVVAHVYCGDCTLYIGKRKMLGEQIVCPICHNAVAKEAAKYFVTISLKAQLQHFLSRPGVAEYLKYRERRVKHQEDAIEDVYDGDYYRSIRVDGQELMNSMNFTFTINTDGCKIRRGGKDSIVPVYARLNELPPKLRQKFMFLLAVCVDVKEPNMQCFLKPVVSELNSLSSNGIVWQPYGQAEVLSKFVTICHCVDGKAMWQILNMTSHAGYYPCTQCTYQGVRIDNYMRFPIQHADLPPHEMRTHMGMLRDMRQVEMQVPRPESVRGHRGASALALLSGHDMVKGNAFDDLHYFYECAAFHHTKLILDEAPRVDNGLVGNNYIKQLELISHAAYLLSMDSITDADIEKAERFIKLYLQQYEALFGVGRTRLNLHSLKHAPSSVRLLGPLWCHSTFNFESWNHQVLQLVTSPKGMLSQIVTRHLLRVSLEMALEADEEDAAEDVKGFIAKILGKRRRKDGREVAAHTYVLGPPDQRGPRDAEIHVLGMEGIQCAGDISVYNKVCIRSVDYKTARTQKAHHKSNDSTVFTYQNTFCTITDIVSFTDIEGREICGMFVKEHQVAHPSPFSAASHIKQVLPECYDLPHFIRIQEVRSPVIKVFVDGNRYFIPMPNTTEID